MASLLILGNANLAWGGGCDGDLDTMILKMSAFAPAYVAALAAVNAAPGDKVALQNFMTLYEHGLGKPLPSLALPAAPIDDLDYLDMLERMMTVYPDFPSKYIHYLRESEDVVRSQEYFASHIINANCEHGFKIVLRALRSNNFFVAMPMANMLGGIKDPQQLTEALKIAATRSDDLVRFGAALSIKASAIRSPEIEAIRLRLESDPHSGVAAVAKQAGQQMHSAP